MRFTSLIAVSSLVITLGAFQVAAVQEDASLATFESNSPMINLARRAEPEAEGAAEGGEAGEAAQVPDVAEAQKEAEAAEAQNDQVLPADGGKENNRNEGRGGDGGKEKGAQEASDENVMSAEVVKPQKVGKTKKHAKAAGQGGAVKASKKGASKASKGPKAFKASKEQGLADESEMGSSRRARKAGHSGKNKMARPASRGGRVSGHQRIGGSGHTRPRKAMKKTVSRSSVNGGAGAAKKSGGGGLLKGLTGGLTGGLPGGLPI